MIFEEALKALRERKIVKRSGWKDGYLLIAETMVWKKDLERRNINLLPSDILADDWEIYSEERK